VCFPIPDSHITMRRFILPLRTQFSSVSILREFKPRGLMCSDCARTSSLDNVRLGPTCLSASPNCYTRNLSATARIREVAKRSFFFWVSQSVEPDSGLVGVAPKPAMKKAASENKSARCSRSRIVIRPNSVPALLPRTYICSCLICGPITVEPSI